MDLCHGGLQEISKAAGHTNPNLDSDLVVAYNLFVAGFNSALHLMKQNIPGITNEKAVDLFNEKIEVFVEKHAEIVAEIKEKLEIQ